MQWWEALVLGIVQGLGEFLPISSSGHLVLFQNIFGIEGNVLFFDTMLHMATLVAVMIAMRKDIWDILKKPIRKSTLWLIIATIPAVIIALLFKDFIKSSFGGGYLGYGFLITAILLFLTAKIKAPKLSGDNNLDQVGGLRALWIGCAQAFAIMPGISRAGSTITAGLLTGLDRSKAARFSFMMSIPAILGSFVFQLKDIADVGISAAMNGMSLGSMLLGMVAAAVFGFLAIKWIIVLIDKGKFWVFGIYLSVLGILVVLDTLVFHLVF